MEIILRVFQVFLALGLIGVVLLQRSEGGGLGLGSSGGMGSFMSVRGTANFLSRLTAILAALFMATCLALALIAKPSTAPKSIFDVPAPATQAPAAPPPAAPAPAANEAPAPSPAPSPAPAAETAPSAAAPAPAQAPAAPAAPAPAGLQPVAPATTPPTSAVQAPASQPETSPQPQAAAKAKHKKTPQPGTAPAGNP